MPRPRLVTPLCQYRTSPRKERMNWRRMVALNLIISVVATAVVSIFGDIHNARGIANIFAMCFIYSFTIGSFCAFVLSNIAPDPETSRFPWGWIVVVMEIVVSVAVGTVFASLILLLVGLVDARNYWPQLWLSLKFGCVMGLTFGVGMYMYESTRERLRLARQELQQRQLAEERAHKLAAEARLSSLESRIHPHFLFNTLNSIASLIPEDPRRAEEIVQRLAALLRFSLDANQHRMVPLAQELKIVGDYLEIEKARFGPRLHYSVAVPVEFEQALVPPLCLQTLVENAVKYAVAPRREGGQIHVTAGQTASALLLAVTDDGPGFDLAEIPAGHGIDNLQERLAAIYGDEARLEVSGNDAGASSVRLVLPLSQAQAAHVAVSDE